MKKRKPSYSVYFASELFSIKHLIGNAYLAEAIYEKSHGKFRCVLPQDLELPHANPRLVRDHAIRALLKCDLALFNFDGAELDAGTLVEFMIAKFADIPAVVLRSDHRTGGDQGRRHPWNALVSSYPRTITLLMASLPGYRTVFSRRHAPTDPVLRLAGQHSSATAQFVCEHLATAAVRALNRAVATKPVMPRHLREEVYQWLPFLPGLRGKRKELRKFAEHLLEQKVERDLL